LDNAKIIKNYLRSLDIDTAPDIINTAVQFLDYLHSQNQKINLVGTKDKLEIVNRHFLDSLSILKFKDKFFGSGSKAVDIGSGGGLPGLLLTLFLPSFHWTLVEKSLKKAEFLNQAIKICRINNIEVIRERAEQLAKKPGYREQYDVVLARAVANFRILIELAIPFCKINGKIILYKSRKVFEEIKNHSSMVEELGGKITGIHQISIEGLNEFRVLLEIKKISKTPTRYPRNFAKIKRNNT